MGDLTDQQAAQTVKLTGADLTGLETAFAAVDQFGNLQVDIARDETSDILGTNVGGKRNSQIEISFASAFNSDLITNSNSGTGSASIANGHALYATGTGTTASSQGVSVKSVIYRPAHEQYAFFTAAFTTPTSVNSFQRIGIYDANNGFFIGYSGLTFGLTKRTATVDTFIPKPSFNVDTLTGASTSQFTRNGIPEAIDLTKSNLFRIRFAWLGSANILFEVFSPDGKWVLFHNIKQPNLALNPSVTNPNLPMAVQVSKTGADSNNLILYTACWAAGTTSDLQPITETLSDETLASLTRSVIAGRASTGGGTYYNVKVTPSGSLTTAIGDITGIVGQQDMANSLPVVVASDQSPVDAGVTLGDQYTPTTPDTGTVQTKLLTDPDNQLKIRGDVLTDEGTYRDDFSGSALNPDWTLNEVGTVTTTVASSFLTLTSGTNAENCIQAIYPGDYSPISLRTNLALSARNANQVARVGFINGLDPTSVGAFFEFTGTSNTQVTCVTQSSSDPSDLQTTSVTYFNGLNSSQNLEYYVEVQPDQVTFLINGQQVAQHRLHLPGPYDSMDLYLEIKNTNITSSASFVFDYIYLINQNSLQVNNSFDGDSLPIRQKTGFVATYATAIAGFTYAANGTDIFTIQGSNSRVIRIKHISVDGTQTATATRTVNLLKRSSPNTGGTSVVLPITPYDSSNPPATATVRYYTANPTTLGTLVGAMHTEKLIIPAAGATVEDSLVWSTIDATTMQDITLRSSNEVVAINMAGVSSNGNSMNIDIVFTEE